MKYNCIKEIEKLATKIVYATGDPNYEQWLKAARIYLVLMIS